MREKRRYFRFIRQLRTRCFPWKGMGEWQECTLVDVSRVGVRILLHEKIDLETTICLAVTVPGNELPVNLRGILKRLEPRGDTFVGGVELTNRLDDDKFIQLVGNRSHTRKAMEEGNEEVSRGTENGCRLVNAPSLLARHDSIAPPAMKALASMGAPLSLLSLVLFLSLPLFVLLVKGYLSGAPYGTDGAGRDVTARPQYRSSQNTPHPVMPDRGIDPDEARFASGPAPSPKRRVMLKMEGGSLYSLALKHYHRASETLYDLILRANPGITDVRSVDDNQAITLPVITAESYLRKVFGETYQVHVGTFENSALVILCSDRVIGLGKQLIIQPHRFSPKDTWYRLLIGNFTSREDALRVVAILNRRGIIYIPPKQRE